MNTYNKPEFTQIGKAQVEHRNNISIGLYESPKFDVAKHLDYLYERANGYPPYNIDIFLAKEWAREIPSGPSVNVYQIHEDLPGYAKHFYRYLGLDLTRQTNGYTYFCGSDTRIPRNFHNDYTQEKTIRSFLSRRTSFCPRFYAHSSTHKELSEALWPIVTPYPSDLWEQDDYVIEQAFANFERTASGNLDFFDALTNSITHLRCGHLDNKLILS